MQSTCRLAKVEDISWGMGAQGGVPLILSLLTLDEGNDDDDEEEEEGKEKDVNGDKV